MDTIENISHKSNNGIITDDTRLKTALGYLNILKI